MRALGVDYGEKKIGIAVSDHEGRMAFPFEVIRDTSRENAVKRIKELLGERPGSVVVVGLPLNFNQEETGQSKDARAFGALLAKELGIEVFFENETFTTASVEKNNAAPKHMSDASSAALILQMYLDKSVIQ